MKSTKYNPPPPRQQVLVTVDEGGYIEIYCGSNIEPRIVRKPTTGDPVHEPLVDDVVAMMLPERFRKLFFPAYVRANGHASPLPASALCESRRTKRIIRELNDLAENGPPEPKQHPAIAAANRHAVAHRIKQRRASQC